jgi:hypothetical protein
MCEFNGDMLVIDTKFELNEEQKSWFGNRLNEGATGRVAVPSHLYPKFREIYGNELLSKNEIKSYLLRHCYT